MIRLILIGQLGLVVGIAVGFLLFNRPAGPTCEPAPAVREYRA